jgi:hypothetical protein
VGLSILKVKTDHDHPAVCCAQPIRQFTSDCSNLLRCDGQANNTQNTEGIIVQERHDEVPETFDPLGPTCDKFHLLMARYVVPTRRARRSPYRTHRW